MALCQDVQDGRVDVRAAGQKTKCSEPVHSRRDEHHCRRHEDAAQAATGRPRARWRSRPAGPHRDGASTSPESAATHMQDNQRQDERDLFRGERRRDHTRVPPHPRRCCRSRRRDVRQAPRRKTTRRIATRIVPDTYPTASVCSGWTANSAAPTNAATPLHRLVPPSQSSRCSSTQKSIEATACSAHAGHMESERVQVPREPVERIRKVYERPEGRVDDQESDVGRSASERFESTVS